MAEAEGAGTGLRVLYMGHLGWAMPSFELDFQNVPLAEYLGIALKQLGKK